MKINDLIKSAVLIESTDGFLIPEVHGGEYYYSYTDYPFNVSGLQAKFNNILIALYNVITDNNGKGNSNIIGIVDNKVVLHFTSEVKTNIVCSTHEVLEQFIYNIRYGKEHAIEYCNANFIKDKMFQQSLQYIIDKYDEGSISMHSVYMGENAVRFFVEQKVISLYNGDEKDDINMFCTHYNIIKSYLKLPVEIFPDLDELWQVDSGQDEQDSTIMKMPFLGSLSHIDKSIFTVTHTVDEEGEKEEEKEEKKKEKEEKGGEKDNNKKKAKKEKAQSFYDQQKNVDTYQGFNLEGIDAEDFDLETLNYIKAIREKGAGRFLNLGPRLRELAKATGARRKELADSIARDIKQTFATSRIIEPRTENRVIDTTKEILNEAFAVSLPYNQIPFLSTKNSDVFLFRILDEKTIEGERYNKFVLTVVKDSTNQSFEASFYGNISFDQKANKIFESLLKDIIETNNQLTGTEDDDDIFESDIPQKENIHELKVLRGNISEISSIKILSHTTAGKIKQDTQEVVIEKSLFSTILPDINVERLKDNYNSVCMKYGKEKIEGDWTFN